MNYFVVLPAMNPFPVDIPRAEPEIMALRKSSIDTKQDRLISPLKSLARRISLAALASPLSALALVGGSGVAPNTADSPWAGVGSLSVGGAKFTGTLIAPGYVLTAAHIALGADPATISFQINAGSTYTVSASDIYVNPGYTGSSFGNLPGDPSSHDDLAIIKLTDALPSDVPFYNLFSGSLQSKDLSFVSFAGSITSKSVGENRADVLFADSSGIKEVYAFDYDGPDLTSNRIGSNIAANGSLGANREASLVAGDSGSSAFVNVNGEWQLAGINTFSLTFANGPTTAGQFGTGGGGMALPAYSSWINSIVASPVPEPEAWLMLLSGLGILASVTRRRDPKLQRL